MHTQTAESTLHRQAGFEITAEKQTIVFVDHSSLTLHTVLHNGVPSLYWRAAFIGPGMWQRFDVRHAAPELHAELPLAYDRDVPGLIAYSLRYGYPSARALLAQIEAPKWRAGPYNNEIVGQAS